MVAAPTPDEMIRNACRAALEKLGAVTADSDGRLVWLDHSGVDGQAVPIARQMLAEHEVFVDDKAIQSALQAMYESARQDSRD